MNLKCSLYLFALPPYNFNYLGGVSVGGVLPETTGKVGVGMASDSGNVAGVEGGRGGSRYGSGPESRLRLLDGSGLSLGHRLEGRLLAGGSRSSSGPEDRGSSSGLSLGAGSKV